MTSSEIGKLAAAGDWLDGDGEQSRPAISSMNMSTACSLASTGLDSVRAFQGLKVGWDAGNGAAGPALEKLAARLPGEHHLLFTEVDGNFPNHHPDPTVEANLD